jgi:hypothetical protein
MTPASGAGFTVISLVAAWVPHTLFIVNDMCVVPALMPVTTPEKLIAPAAGLDDDQVP